MTINADNNTIANQMLDLKKLRKAAGLTQHDLARLVGKSRGYLAEIEIGKHRLPKDAESRIHNILIICCLQKLRRAIPNEERIKDTLNNIKRLKAIELEDFSKILTAQVLIMELDDRSPHYFWGIRGLVNGATALYANLSFGGTVDIILLSDYQNTSALIEECRKLYKNTGGGKDQCNLTSP